MQPSVTTDEVLIERLRNGDLAAFDVLYGRYEGRLFGYIRRMVPDRAAAEDIFQEVLFKVLRDRSFDPDRGRFSAWLFTVARNRCLQELRKHERRSALGHLAAPPSPTDEASEDALARVTRVRKAMERLDEPQRQLLLLKQVGDLTYREIGEILGVAEGTIKSRLHAAMKSFRTCLAELGEIDELGGTKRDPLKGSPT